MGRRKKGSPDLPAVTSAKLPKSIRGLVLRKKRTPLSRALAHFPGGRAAVFQMLTVAESEEAKRLVKAYERCEALHSVEGFRIEQVLEDAGVSAKAFIGLVYSEAYQLNVDLGNAIANFHYPRMMAASVKRAQEPDATAERKMHFEASGYVPTKSGIQIGIKNVNSQTVEDEPEPGHAPSVSRTARRIVRDLPSGQ